MTRRTDEPNAIACSFCGREQAQVQQLIGGPGPIFICDECVVLCQQMISKGSSSHNRETPSAPLIINPKAICNKLDEYVIGQEQAKKVLSVAVYNHYKRIRSQDLSESTVELQKTNILLTGPTGSGKTLLAQTLARVLDVPFCIADATSVTEAGYVGEDVENILLRLIQAADYDVSRAEQGIVYIDEIDKIGRKNANPSITRDVSGEGVQQALLKIIEGCTASVPPQGGRKHPHQELISISTDRILFICGGTFEGLDNIVSSRISKENQGIGFRSNLISTKSRDHEDLLQDILPEDLISYGFIPEFVGRLPVVVNLDSLDKDSLVRILTEPKNAILKQFQHLFSLDNVELTFSQDALEATAEESLQRKTGARGLRSIIEQVLLEVMYEIPSITGVNECIINADVIRGHQQPILLNDSGNVINIRLFRGKTA